MTPCSTHSLLGLFLLIVAASAGPYDGYSGSVSQDVAQPIYPLIFQNLGELNLCTLTGSIVFSSGNQAATSTVTPLGALLRPSPTSTELFICYLQSPSNFHWSVHRARFLDLH